MAREIDGALATHFDGDIVRPFFLVEAFFKAETVRLFTGHADLSYDSKTWVGTGTLVDISSIEETYELKAGGIRVSLSGVPTDMLSLALSDEYHGRDFILYMGAFTEARGLVADPVIVFRGFMDTMQINENGETSMITLSVENRLIDLERPRVRRYTSEDQKVDYPADKGFDFVVDLQDKGIRWGRE